MKFSAYFTSFGSRADGSAGLRFSTQELTSSDFAELKLNLNSQGWLVFETQEEKIEIPKESLTDDTKKPSQRLRAVIYLVWKKKGEEGDFEAYYKGQIEVIINRYKDKLD